VPETLEVHCSRVIRAMVHDQVIPLLDQSFHILCLLAAALAAA